MRFLLHLCKSRVLDHAPLNNRFLDIPERPVKPARKLCRITHQTASVRITFLDKLHLDRFNAAVHHVTRRDDVRTSFRVCEGDFGDTVCRRGRVEVRSAVEEVGCRCGSRFSMCGSCVCGIRGASRIGLRQRGRVDERVRVRVDTVSMGLDDLLAVLGVGGGYAAVAVVGVFTQADVSGEKKSREELGKKLERLYDRSYV